MKSLNLVLIIISSILVISCANGDYDGTPSGATAYGYESGNGNGNGSQPTYGVLTAAEWNDLYHWDFWNSLMQNSEYYSFAAQWGFNVSGRYSLNIKNTLNQPIRNIPVKMLSENNEIIWEAKTNNRGRAELWENLFATENAPSKIVVGNDGETDTITSLMSYNQGIMVHVMEKEVTTLAKIDVCFIVDATGSMGDELEYLKSELINVIGLVETELGQCEIRLGATFYRDNGDIYLVRKFALTTDINSIIENIRQQFAGGGGDYPEAVDEALNAAIVNEQWDASADARIAFLLLDAPPHNETMTMERVKSAIESAARQGVKIIPVSASGIDKSTEFLLRFFAIATNGTYTFITDDSGVGNTHIEPTTGEYQIEYLNDLLSRLIIESSSLSELMN